MSRSVFISRIITATLMLIIGVVVRIDTADLPFGSLKRIQSGFFPTVFGNLMIALSIVMLIGLIISYVKHKVNEPEEDNQLKSVQGFLIFLGIMSCFLAINHFFGFIIAIFVAIIASSYALGLKGWKLVVLGGSTTLFIWLLFDLWLSLNLPVGIIFS